MLLVEIPVQVAQMRNELCASSEGLRFDPEMLARTHEDCARTLREWKDVPATLRIYGL